MGLGAYPTHNLCGGSAFGCCLARARHSLLRCMDMSTMPSNWSLGQWVIPQLTRGQCKRRLQPSLTSIRVPVDTSPPDGWQRRQQCFEAALLAPPRRDAPVAAPVVPPRGVQGAVARSRGAQPPVKVRRRPVPGSSSRPCCRTCWCASAGGRSAGRPDGGRGR